MLTKTLISSTLAGLAASAPLISRQTSSAVGLIALHSASEVHLQSINENDFRFWVGKNTTTYCPSEEVSDCPTGTPFTTLFPPTTNGTGVSMNTEVPGGQYVYVLPDGEVAVTEAHSGDAEDGGVFVPFSYIPPISEGQIGELLFNGSSFAACPSTDANVYQIYATGASQFVRTDCIGITAGTSTYTGDAVWQYV